MFVHSSTYFLTDGTCQCARTRARCLSSPLCLSSKVSKFADNTKLRIDAADPVSMRPLKRDLAVNGEWSSVWQTPFNLDKFHFLHVGSANQAEKYSLLGSEISSVTQERDLGVIITMDLKSSVQCIAEENNIYNIV